MAHPGVHLILFICPFLLFQIPRGLFLMPDLQKVLVNLVSPQGSIRSYLTPRWRIKVGVFWDILRQDALGNFIFEPSYPLMKLRTPCWRVGGGGCHINRRQPPKSIPSWLRVWTLELECLDLTPNSATCRLSDLEKLLTSHASVASSVKWVWSIFYFLECLERLNELVLINSA